MKKLLIIAFICSLVKVEAQTSAFASIDSLVQVGRYKIALNQLEKMPSSFLSNNKIASIYNAIDDYKKASTYYEKSLLFKNDYLTKIKLGTAYRKLKNYAKAITIFEGITQQDPENLLVQYQLGKLYLLTRQSKKAVKVFKKLIAKDSWNANYSYQLGLAYAQLKKRNLKMNNFINAYIKDSTHIKAIERLAMDFILLRDQDSSNLFIEKGLQINPNHIQLNRMRTNNLFRQKKYKEAIAVLEKLDTLKPNEHYTKKMLGRTYYNLGELDKAKEYFELSEELDPDDFKSLTYLGHIYFKQKQYHKAMFKYSFASFKAKRKRDEEYIGLAQVHYQLKEPEKAIKNFKKATQENTKNYKALYQLATLSDDYYKDKQIAYKLYKRYIDRFEEKDTLMTAYVKNRIKEIKKHTFFKQEKNR